jgi:hypothetical protein
MALADPLEMTLYTEVTPLPRVDSGNHSGTYMSSDGNTEVVFSHSKGKRDRGVIRINHKKVVPDLFLADLSNEVSASFSLVFDSPLAGYSGDDLAGLFSGLLEMISADSAAILAQFLGGES